MRQLNRRLRLVAAVAVVGGVAVPATASAATIAYLDGKEVWIANTDGSNKTRLSAGEGDWTAVSQNPLGWIVGVQLESGKISDLSRFTVWNPQGTIQYRGPLARAAAGPSYAYPLGLNITASGGAVVYGYSAYTYAFPVGSLQSGFYYLPSSTVVTPALGPLSIGSAQYVALTAGDRVIGTISDRAIGAQTPDSSSSSTFLPWIGFGSGQPFRYSTIDASDSGSIVVAAVNEPNGTGSGPDLQRINVTRTQGTGLPYVDDCFVGVPPADEPAYPTVSPAGDLIAWSDKGGVKLTGVPNLRQAGPPTCELTAPISTISPTGSYPSLGGFDLNGYLARLAGPGTTGPTTGAGGATGGSGGSGTGGSSGGGSSPVAPTPAVTPTLAVKVTGTPPKLSTGTTTTVTFTPSVTGIATAAITVDPKSVGQKGRTPITIAGGTGNATAGKRTSVKVKLSKKGKSLRKKLTKGKKAKLSVTINAATTTVDIKLG